MARDFTGFLREHTGNGQLDFEPKAPIPLDDAESQIRALAWVSAETSALRGAFACGAVSIAS